MREIADSVGAMLFVDMAHIAGLVAGGVHPSPVPARGFRHDDHAQEPPRPARRHHHLQGSSTRRAWISQVFPGVQGGPLMHVIAAKAVCFHEALQPTFKAYARADRQQCEGARRRSPAPRLPASSPAAPTTTSCSSISVRKGLNGKVAQETLDHAGITVNKNGIPFDTEKITLGGGIRVGTPAVTTRGMREEEMMEIADLIHRTLTNRENPTRSRRSARKCARSPAAIRCPAKNLSQSPMLS